MPEIRNLPEQVGMMWVPCSLPTCSREFLMPVGEVLMTLEMDGETRTILNTTVCPECFRRSYAAKAYVARVKWASGEPMNCTCEAGNSFDHHEWCPAYPTQVRG